ncbi:Protein ssh4 [Entomophthora muscae]|uniref:Protein ssh4 n=1 Tax=Entomophthora muscae TaxID=34485 RepID=A0ACC2U179_9FUNG|nr:Protein ssh4 [Entomophthora muscae]
MPDQDRSSQEARPVTWSLIVMAITLLLLLIGGLTGTNALQHVSRVFRSFINWVRFKIYFRRSQVFLGAHAQNPTRVQSLCSLVHRQLSFTVISHNSRTIIDTESPTIILESPGLIQANIAIPLASSAIFFEFLFIHLPFHSNLTLGLAPKDDTGLNIPGRCSYSFGLESAYRRLFVGGIVVSQTYIRPLLRGDRVGCIYDQRAKTVCFLHNGYALPIQPLPTSLVNRRDLHPTVYTDHSCTIVPNFDKFTMPLVH